MKQAYAARAKQKEPRTAVAAGRLGKRRRLSSLLSVRVADAKAFEDFLRSHNIVAKKDGSQVRAPRGVMTRYLRGASTKELGKRELQRAIVYLKRAWSASAAVADPTKKGPRIAAGAEVRRYSTRKRVPGSQGRPAPSSLVKELLLEWFQSLRRSVTTRIPPKAALNEALSLMESAAVAARKEGRRARVADATWMWLKRWREEFGISLRRPNRKWKVPRAILSERLRIAWVNSIRIREAARLLLGQDSMRMWNVDQCPFHVNEAGSKATGALAVRGAPTAPLKEGHAQTRRRWSVCTVVDSAAAEGTTRTAVAAATPQGPPPLGLMFRAEGQRLAERLRAHIPRWAPWLTIVMGPKCSYRESHLLDFFEAHLPLMEEGRDWRVLWLDFCKPHQSDALRRLAWTRGFCMLHGG